MTIPFETSQGPHAPPRPWPVVIPVVGGLHTWRHPTTLHTSNPIRSRDQAFCHKSCKIVLHFLRLTWKLPKGLGPGSFHASLRRVKGQLSTVPKEPHAQMSPCSAWSPKTGSFFSFSNWHRRNPHGSFMIQSLQKLRHEGCVKKRSNLQVETLARPTH